MEPGQVRIDYFDTGKIAGDNFQFIQQIKAVLENSVLFVCPQFFFKKGITEFSQLFMESRKIFWPEKSGDVKF